MKRDTSTKQWGDLTGKQKVAVIIAGIFGLFVFLGIVSAATPPEDKPAEPTFTREIAPSQTSATSTTPPAPAADSTAKNAQPAPQTKEPSIPAEYKSAPSKATSYANTQHMSK